MNDETKLKDYADLISRLRNEGSSAFHKHLSLGMWTLCSEAADAIESLMIERDTLDVMTEVGFKRTMESGEKIQKANEFIIFVRDWVAKPVGSYSVADLNRLFGVARNKIAELRRELCT